MEKLKAGHTGSSSYGLKVEGLSRKYRRFRLKNVSFEIPPGNILGLLGRNGAGKTTTIRILTGNTSADRGNIWLNGVNMRKNRTDVQARTGFVLDEHMFLETESLWKNGLVFGRFYPDFTEERWKRWLSVCGLDKSERLGWLSQGSRMKFQFAFAMAHRPRLLLLDEPTGNLDAVFRKEFLGMLQEAVEEEQLSVLFSSHLTSDLEQVADRIALIEQGEILYTDSVEHLLSRYCRIKGSPEMGRKLRDENYPEIVGIQVSSVGFDALLDRQQIPENRKTLYDRKYGLARDWLKETESGILCEDTDLSWWMYHMTKGGGDGEKNMGKHKRA